MGDCVKCVTTPEKQVTQGDANPLQIGCVTTPTPTGGVGVVRQQPLAGVVTQSRPPMRRCVPASCSLP